MQGQKRLKIAGALAALALWAAPAPGWAGGNPDPVRFGVNMEVGDEAYAKKLLDEGMDPNFEADRIGSGLMIAAWEGNISLMELFWKRGADVNYVNRTGEQALMHAAWKGKMEAVKWLLDRGASVNRLEKRQWSALHYAVFAGNKAIAELLIERGADVNALSTNGSSVLMMAAREGHADLAKQLLARGADASPKNDWGDGALEWAMKNGNLAIAKMVASQEDFALAMSKPKEAWGQSTRSVPLPEQAEDLLREQRKALAEGQEGKARLLREQFHLALAELAKAKPIAAALPSVPGSVRMEVTASRQDPSSQSAKLLFTDGYSKDPFSTKASANKKR